MIDKKSYSRLQNWALYVWYSSRRSIVAAMSTEVRRRNATRAFRLTSVATSLQGFVQLRSSLFQTVDAVLERLLSERKERVAIDLDGLLEVRKTPLSK